MLSSTVNTELLKMIRCPVTGTTLSPANAELIRELNKNIELGRVVDRIDQPVTEKVDAGLINEDRSLLLPIRGEIVVLVSDRAIPILTWSNVTEQ